MPDAADAKAQRELQIASIADLQGSIHANDAKSSAGLIVHGLLFAGTLTVTTRVGEVYADAAPWVRGLGTVAVVIALLAFVASVIALLLAVRPYEAKGIQAKIRGKYHSVFFPDLDALGKAGAAQEGKEMAALRDEIVDMDAKDLGATYAAEAVKLADIRRHEAERAKVFERASEFHALEQLRERLDAALELLAADRDQRLSADTRAREAERGRLAQEQHVPAKPIRSCLMARMDLPAFGC